MELIDRLGPALRREDFLIDQLQQAVGPKSILHQCWETSQAIEYSKLSSDEAWSVLHDFSGKLGKLINQEFLSDFHVTCGTTVMNGPTSEFECQPAPVFIVNPADPRNDCERRALDPFVVVRRDVLRYDNAKQAFVTVSLDHSQVFLFSEYRRSKDSNLIGIVPVELNVREAFWIKGELALPGTMLAVRRQLKRSSLFPGEMCKVTLDFENSGNRTLIIPAFQEHAPNGTEIVAGESEISEPLEIEPEQQASLSYELRVLTPKPISRRFPTATVHFRDFITNQESSCLVNSEALRVETHSAPRLIVNRRSRQTHIPIDEAVEIAVDIENSGSPIEHLEVTEELAGGVELLSGGIKYAGPIAGKARTEILKYSVRFTQKGAIGLHARWDRTATRPFPGRYAIADIEWNDPPLQITVYSGTAASLAPALTTGNVFARNVQVASEGPDLVVTVTLSVRNEGGRSARDISFNERLPTGFRYSSVPELKCAELASGQTTEFHYRAVGHRMIDLSWPEVAIVCRDVLDGNLSLSVPAFSLERFHDPESIGLVGRNAELSRLLRVAEQVRPDSGGHIHGFPVIGGEGIGKSRLLAEFRRQLKTWDGTEVFYSAVRDGQLDSSVFSSLVAGWVGEPAGPTLSSPNFRDWQIKTLNERLQASLQYRPELEDSRKLQSILRDDERDVVIIRNSLFALLSDLTKIAERRVVVVIDDLHWLSKSGLEKLDSMVEDGKKLAGLLFVFGSRRSPGLNQFLNGFDHKCELEPLNKEETASLIDSIASYPRIESSLRSDLQEATQGNPFHVIQSLQYLRSAGNLERVGGEWHLTDALTRQGANALVTLLPAGSYSLVQKRVEKELIARQRNKEAEILKVLSLFVNPALVETLEKICLAQSVNARAEMTDALGELERMGFIRSLHGVVEFRADAQREAIQRSIGTETEAAVLHGRIARELAKLAEQANDEKLRNEFYHHLLYSDRATQFEFREKLSDAALAFQEQGELRIAKQCSEILLEHETRRDEQFIQVLNLAEIRAALGEGDIPSLFAKARTLLKGVSWRQRRRLGRKLDQAEMRYEAERNLFHESFWLGLLGGVLSPVTHVYELRGKAEGLVKTGKPEDAAAALRLADQGLNLSHRRHDIENECRFVFLKARACRIAGQPGKSQELHLQMLKLAQSIPNRYTRNRLMTQSSSQIIITDLRSLYREGYSFETILELLRDALDFQRRNDDRAGEGYTLRTLGLLYEKEGEPEQAFLYYESAIKLLRGADFSTSAEVLVHLASILNSADSLPGLKAREDRLRLAVKYLEEVHEGFEKQGAYPYEYTDWLQSLNEIYVELNNPEDRRKCLLHLDDRLGSDTKASGYESDIAELDMVLAARAANQSNWPTALELISHSEAMEALAQKRSARFNPLRIRRSSLRFNVLVATNQIGAARQMLRSLTQSAAGQRSAARLLSVLLGRFTKLWNINNDPPDTVISDYGQIIEAVCAVDTRLADDFYDRTADFAHSRLEPELITELGLLTARVLGSNGDPGAAFRYSRKILEDQYALRTNTEASKQSLLHAYALFAQYVDDDDLLGVWTDQIRNLFLEKEDYSVLGHLAKIQGDRALAKHDAAGAGEHYFEAQTLWREHCKRDKDLFRALSSLVVGFLNCNRASAAVELLEDLLEISLETGDYRNVFDYYDMLANSSTHVVPTVVRRLLAKVLTFYLRTEQPQRRGHFAYQTSKLIGDTESERSDSLVDLRLGFNRVLIGLNVEPANQFHDMGVARFAKGDPEPAIALFELSLERQQDSSRLIRSRVAITNLAVTYSSLAGAFNKLNWHDDAIRHAVTAIKLIAFNLRAAFEEHRKLHLSGPAEILAFNFDVSIFLGVQHILTEACRTVNPFGFRGDGLVPMFIDVMPLETDQRIGVVSRLLEQVEKAIEDGLGLDQNIFASGLAATDRREIRDRIRQHKIEFSEEAEELSLDVFARRKELDRLFWQALRRVSWEGHAALLLVLGRIDEVEAQAASALTGTDVSSEARKALVGRLIQYFEKAGKPEKLEYWKARLVISEA
jgi:tetratricopeptide (TPR) repeat protein